MRGTIGFFRSVENPADVVSLRACLKLIWHCPEDLVQGFSTVWQRADPQKIDEQFEQITADYQQIGLLQQWMALYHAFRLLLWKNRPRKLLERWAEKIALGENEAYRALLEAAVFHKEMPAFLQLLALGQESDIARSEKAYTSGMVTPVSYTHLDVYKRQLNRVHDNPQHFSHISDRRITCNTGQKPDSLEASRCVLKISTRTMNLPRRLDAAHGREAEAMPQTAVLSPYRCL